MAAPLEKLLEYLVKDGLLTREKADECLRTRAEAVEKGENSSMTDIVVSKGGVDPARLSMALLAVKQVALICPKCRKRHTTKNASLDMAYPCKRCGTPLEAEEIVPSGSGPIRKLEDPSPREVVEARRDPRRVFGKYTLLQELGRGGYAVVYKAWDSLLAQYVALKLIRSEEEGLTDAPPAGEAEILREARTAARLSHPHIVRIWEVGTQGDRHFLSMEYVEGKSLARLLKPEGKSPRLPVFYSSMKRLLVILRDVARALHHAHSNRPPIVHRDVKPQNILVDPKGRACLVDFGLAREMTKSGGRLTVTGVTKGTPCYMAPEQALGRAVEVDARTDVWALGAILYEFLAGKPPFRGPTDRDILNQVVHEDPRRPSDVLKAEGHRAPPFADLEKVCLKALEKDRTRRYATAEEFAEEIDRFLSGQTVQAKVASGAAQFFRWIGRRKALAAAVAAAVVMTGVALGLLLRGDGPPQVVERVVVEKDPSARLSRAAREIERLAADFQYDVALRKYQDLIDGEPDAVERGLLRQRMEDVRLQRAVLEGLVQRIQMEPRDFPAFRLKTGFPEPCRVIDANLERLLLRRRSEHEEVAWRQLDPRQFAALVRDFWPRIEGRAALGFGVWCLRQGLTEEAASVFERQSEPQAQRYLDELAVRSQSVPAAPDAAGESPRDRILRQAEEALAKGDFVIARARFERVLMLKPGDADAVAGLQRTAEVEKSTQEAQVAAPKPAIPEATPVPGLPAADALPAPAANAPAAGPTPEQIRVFEWLRRNASSSLRSRHLGGAASAFLTALGKNEAEAAQWGPALNRIAGGNPGAPEVRAALTEVEKLLALEIRDPEVAVKLLFDLRDLFAISLIHGEVGPAVDRVIQAREVVELRSFGGKVKLGILEKVRGSLTFSETLMSGGQKATIGWPVNLWGGAGTRLNASDLVALVRKDRNKRAVAAGWRDVLGEGLVLLYEDAARNAADVPELQEAARLASEDDRKILRMSEYVRLSAASSGKGSADPAPGENPGGLLSSGLEKNAAGDYRGAIEDFTRAIALNGSDPAGYYSRAYPRMNLKDFAGAIADCDRAIQLAGPGSPLLSHYHNARARVKQLQGDLDGAVADYTQAIAQKVDFAEPYRERGRLVHRRRQWAAAVADLTRAMELEPNRAEDHFARARCHYDAGSWDAAATDCRRAVELGVRNEDYTRLYLWMSLARAGQAASARGDLRAYFLRRPSEPAPVAWFKKVAALLVDDLTEDGLLKQAEAERDERLRKEYLCEAWFYAGTKRLLAGDASGAATFFQRSIDTRIETFMEYTSSVAELDRLGIARPAAKAALAKLPAAWETAQGGWYYRSLKTDFNGVLEIRPREGYLLGIGWVRTDKDYTWIQVGIPSGDTCRWIFINQQGERGTAEYRLTPARSLQGTWSYGAVSRPNEVELARPTRTAAALDGALRTLASLSEKDMFKSEAEARAWVDQALGDLRR